MYLIGTKSLNIFQIKFWKKILYIDYNDIRLLYKLFTL